MSINSLRIKHSSKESKYFSRLKHFLTVVRKKTLSDTDGIGGKPMNYNHTYLILLLYLQRHILLSHKTNLHVLSLCKYEGRTSQLQPLYLVSRCHLNPENYYVCLITCLGPLAYFIFQVWITLSQKEMPLL